ncbi:hypothetical protein [Embleya scabrispora]|uniref:hypothetical protein n=1 Tax=Embleya scabrispora TaxID=159449 RepID=UPI0003725EF8|nr:hypothetical protein [Embleya scabrispora]MYS85413.1 hypothetical protein [Streptomyces sp. SID5474]
MYNTALHFALTFALTVRDRYRRKVEEEGSDAGLTSLEVALIAAGVGVLAVGLIAVITKVVNGKISIINGF